MGFWREPQKTWLRRAFFQIHLWTGLAVGLYIIVISLTGSIIVFRRDLVNAVLPTVPPAAPGVTALTEEQLRTAVLAAYPGYRIDELTLPERRQQSAAVTLTRGAEKQERRFNPYTGEDMGSQNPRSLAVMDWVVDLHDNLLLNVLLGRRLNAIGGMVVTLLCLTGLVIWWRGARAWVRGLYFSPGSGWKRINFDLHSALGFWSLAILLVWAVSGIYFGYSEPFVALVDHFEPLELAGDNPRRGDEFLAWLARMHFGRYGGTGVRITYVILGFIPPIIVVTGALMWWNRVVRQWPLTSAPARGSSPTLSSTASAAMTETSAKAS